MEKNQDFLLFNLSKIAVFDIMLKKVSETLPYANAKQTYQY